VEVAGLALQAAGQGWAGGARCRVATEAAQARAAGAVEVAGLALQAAGQGWAGGARCRVATEAAQARVAGAVEVAAGEVAAGEVAALRPTLTAAQAQEAAAVAAAAVAAGEQVAEGRLQAPSQQLSCALSGKRSGSGNWMQPVRAALLSAHLAHTETARRQPRR
jgi:hypothetical protein